MQSFKGERSWSAWNRWCDRRPDFRRCKWQVYGAVSARFVQIFLFSILNWLASSRTVLQHPLHNKLGLPVGGQFGDVHRFWDLPHYQGYQRQVHQHQVFKFIYFFYIFISKLYFHIFYQIHLTRLAQGSHWLWKPEQNPEQPRWWVTWMNPLFILLGIWNYPES